MKTPTPFASRSPLLVLIAGLILAQPCLATAFAWYFTGSPNAGRANHTATVLHNGKVLVEGANAGDTAMAGLYDPNAVTVVADVSGHGFIPAGGGIARFIFYASDLGDQVDGVMTFSDTGSDVRLQDAKVRRLTITGSSAHLAGTGKLTDGTRVSFSVDVMDNGDGSTDTFSISLSNGYSAGGTVTNGDIRIE